ncbi:MAG: GntR family transcriptional regulator [Chloroflexota bacterium]
MALVPVIDTALSERVRRSLKAAILTLELRPGQMLVERQIAQQLHTSTTPVREALRYLSHEGLVVIEPNRRTFVRPLNPRDVEEIYAVREVLEPLAAGLSLNRLDGQTLTELRAVLDRDKEASQLGDTVAMAECSVRFHSVFLANCGNERLKMILDNLLGQVQHIASFAWRYRRTAKSAHEEHERIFDAVFRHDKEAVEAEMRSHVQAARREFLLAFETYQLEQSSTRGTSVESAT